ncbi:MAG: carbohydrate ABC transporter permease [Chloroflexia bacterium]
MAKAQQQAIALQSESALMRRARAGRRRREALTGYFFILPAVAILAVFHFFPILYAVLLSFYQFSVPKGLMPQADWAVGFGNYTRLFGDRVFWQALFNTLWYAGGTVVLGLGLSLGLALLLERVVRGRAFFRTVYFLPYVTSLVVAGTVWQWIFQAPVGTQPGGLANALLESLHLGPSQWLQEPRGIFQLIFAPSGPPLPDWAAGPSLALVTIVSLAVWSVLGFNVVIFLAGLTNIPRDIYDAARVDGATGWRLFRHITWPLLTPTTYFLLIVSTIGAFQSFTPVFSAGVPVGSGGPQNTTIVLTLYFYKAAFSYSNLGLGYASTIAIVLFVLILGLTVFQTRFLSQRVNY